MWNSSRSASSSSSRSRRGRARRPRARRGCCPRRSGRGRSRPPAAGSRCPRRARRYMGRPVTSWPSSSICPRSAVHQAGDHVEDGGLAGAVGPEQAHRLAVSDVEPGILDDGPATISSSPAPPPQGRPCRPSRPALPKVRPEACQSHRPSRRRAAGRAFAGVSCRAGGRRNAKRNPKTMSRFVYRSSAAAAMKSRICLARAGQSSSCRGRRRRCLIPAASPFQAFLGIREVGPRMRPSGRHVFVVIVRNCTRFQRWR